MGSSMGRREFLKSALALSLVSLVDGKPDLDTGSDNLSDSQAAPNVLSLLFDTLSAKHISTYGYPRETMQHLTRFAQQATVYHAHYSGGNYTTPGTASLLTGTYPWTHRAFNMNASAADLCQHRNLFKLLDGDAHTALAYTHNGLVQMLLNRFRKDVELLIDPMEFYAVKDRFSAQLFADDPNIAYHSEDSLLTLRSNLCAHQRSVQADPLSRL